VAAFKSQIRYPRVFNYASDDHCVALDMYYYLLSPSEKKFVESQGITKVKYISHAHGVTVGKAFTEYLKQNAIRLQRRLGINPFKMMYLETCFGFTQGLPADPFYEDVLFDWFVHRTSFDSPGLLYWMQEGIKMQMSQNYKDFTRVEQFMASGSARGVRIDQHEGKHSERVTPNKTQVIVTSGSSLYYANLIPAID